jgi:hypothetical protein
VASWQRGRLVIWEASANLWRPDEIVDDVFETDRLYSPVLIGVEEDGLNEFIMQPLRHAQVARDRLVPVRPLKAPKGKFDFIRSLQPFFRAGEVTMAGPPEAFTGLTSQLLNFRPGYSGPIDAPNALAYFLKLRPGGPVYDGFTNDNVASNLDSVPAPVWLALDAGLGHLGGVVCQFRQGQCRVLADYLVEGDATVEIERLATQARLEASDTGHDLRICAHRRHFEAYERGGLKAAAQREGLRLIKGGDDAKGRAELVRLIAARPRGVPGLAVSSRATWTLRALQGGYARRVMRDGRLSADPEDNAYALIARALESVVALSVAGQTSEDDKDLRYDYTADGRRYLSARA